MLLGIVEKRENSFIQAVNEMSFVIPFHGHHVEGRGGGRAAAPPVALAQAGVLLVAFVPFLFIYLFWKRGKCLKASPRGHPFPMGVPQSLAAPPPPCTKSLPPLPNFGTSR